MRSGTNVYRESSIKTNAVNTVRGVLPVSTTTIAPRLALVAALTTLLSFPAEAGKRLDPSRPLYQGLRVESSNESTVALGALASGPPKRIIGLGTWLTSNYEVDVYTSNYLWCDFENLELVAGFYAASDANVRALVTIRNRAGNLVYQAEDTFRVDANAGNYLIADIGQLEPGFYRVYSKVTQKEKSAKQKFWVQVTDQTDPRCDLPE